MTTVVWLRRDLRLTDHAALSKAVSYSEKIQPGFVFDTDILAHFKNPDDRRLPFIADALAEIHAGLAKHGGGLLVVHGRACEVIPKLAKALAAKRVIAAEDYEPSAIARDEAVAKTVALERVKDQVIFSPMEITRDGQPYKVYTPYSRLWLATLTPAHAAPYEVTLTGRLSAFSDNRQAAANAGVVVLDASSPEAMLSAIGYRYQKDTLWDAKKAPAMLKNFISKKASAYPTMRDMVAEAGTSQLSPYLRFGLISIRECLRQAEAAGYAGKWISELIWREFYAMILFHFPESVSTEWNPAYRGQIPWRHDAALFDAWREGKTGYPLVDAAMRQLLTEGWMHNRARMVVASFLTKDLLLDWRLGEAHFAQYLMDYEQASNVGGWQWAASTGTDAQPYFRVFNPYLQSEKFDPDGDYIRRYVPELASLKGKEIHNPSPLLRPKHYPAPIVDHDEMRKRAIAMFKKG